MQRLLTTSYMRSSQRYYLRYWIMLFLTSVINSSAWATCIGNYCDIDHNSYASPAACAIECVSTPSGGGSTPSYAVITKVEGTGSGTISQTPVPADYPGQTARVQLTALPDATTRFISWSNSFAPECTGTAPDVIVTLNAIKTCIATFEAVPTPRFCKFNCDNWCIRFWEYHRCCQ